MNFLLVFGGGVRNDLLTLVMKRMRTRPGPKSAKVQLVFQLRVLEGIRKR